MQPGTSVRAAQVSEVAARTAERIRRCYRAPRVPSSARPIVTRLAVRFAPAGTLAELPAVLAQQGVTPENADYAATMAKAATLAVMRCAPFRPPAELYAGGWRELEFTFSPKVAV